VRLLGRLEEMEPHPSKFKPYELKKSARICSGFKLRAVD
jgi:hypothetical protein